MIEFILYLIGLVCFFHAGRILGHFEEKRRHERAVKEAQSNLVSLSEWRERREDFGR